MPREVLVREVAAPRELTAREAPVQQGTLVVTRPGPLKRLVGALGREMEQVGRPRVEVDVERNYRVSRSVTTTEVASPPPPAAPIYQPPPPAYAPPPPPVYVPSPQAPYPHPQASPQVAPAPQSASPFHGLFRR